MFVEKVEVNFCEAQLGHINEVFTQSKEKL